MDDREKSRVVFHVNASVKHNDTTINGEVENLSINGMLIKTSEKKGLNLSDIKIEYEPIKI